jgi:outer membrane protein OmpA-like peptidoglycan-associated protein
MDIINRHVSSKDLYMKKSILFIFILSIGLLSFAQSAKEKKANKLFEKQAYVEAAALYKTLPDNKNVLQNLADAYYYNFKMEAAKINYEKLYKTYGDSLRPNVYRRYVHALQGVGDYEKADSIANAHLNKNINTQDFKTLLSETVPYIYEVSPINDGNTSGDFGMNYFGDKVVFASIRNSENPDYLWNNKPFLDLFTATLSEDNMLGNIEPLSEDINTRLHESNVTLSNDGETLYFTRTNKKLAKIDDKKIATVQIYKAQYIDSTWTNIEVLPFSSETYSTQHPILNKDNTKLFFASDMPGSFGSFDIYYVDITDDGYGEPVNMGASINSTYREQFPFVASNGALYFSSDGHQGLGNLDVFRSVYKDSIYLEPQNLGETLNSGMDDFAYVLNEATQKGFLSSNRNDTDQIFSFLRKENKEAFVVEGLVIDKNSKELLPNSLVTLFDENDTVLGEFRVGDDAKYKFQVNANTKYTIEGYKEFYIPNIVEFTTNEEGRIEKNIELEIESYDDAEEIVVTKDDGNVYIELENIYFDLDKWNILPEAAHTLDILVDILKKYPRMEIELGAHTDSRSSDSYNLILSENRARAAVNYIVSNGIAESRLRSKGYGESQPLVNCGDNCTEDQFAINRRCEFIIIK